MKKTLTLLLAMLISSGAIAQSAGELTKEEKKQWKKEARLYKKNPGMLKDLVEAHEEAQAEIGVMEFEMDSLKMLADRYENDMTDMGRKLAKSEKQLKDQKAMVAGLKGEVNEANKLENRYAKGTTFRVQIGAFEKRDMSKFFENTEHFHGEVKGQMQKYTVGIFHNKATAETFKAHLIAIGIKDAWIVTYMDGQRAENKAVTNGSL